MISLPIAEFESLLLVFSHHYIVKSGPGRGGRPPRFVSTKNVLACILHFYSAAVEQKTLCELFGAAPLTMSSVLCKTELTLGNALRKLPDARVQWPSFEQQREWASRVSTKAPLVQGCFIVADGKNYAVQEPTASDLQNAYYNGWLHAVKVTGVLCYGFDETLIWGRHNHLGSWNDGEMSRRLQCRLADPTKTTQEGCCATDSAFPVSYEMSGKIITTSMEGDLERASPECREGLLAMSNAITCVRQSAEWGMGCAPKCYRQLLLPLPYNPNKIRLRLSNIYRLYNLRVQTTGISQIRSVFMSVNQKRQ